MIQTRPNHTGVVMLHEGGSSRNKRITIVPHAAATYSLYTPATPTYISALTNSHKRAGAAMNATDRPDVLVVSGATEIFAQSSVAQAFTFICEDE